MRKKLILAARIAAALVFTAIAVRVLVQEFSSVSAAEVGASLGRIGWDVIGLSVLATLAAFAAVSTYDAFALHYAGKKLGLARSAISSTTSYVVSNLLGFSVFTGNAVRYWLFEHWGLGAAEVAIAAVVTTIVCNLLLALIAGASLVAAPDMLSEIAGLPTGWAAAIGFVLLVAAVVVTVFAVAGPTRLRVWRFAFNHPGPVLIPHLLVCVVDYMATAAVFYVLIAPDLAIDFIPFAIVFSIAKLIGIVSNVPGGLGVFEAAMAGAMASLPPADLAAALIAYRCIFYLAPFAVAAIVLAVHGLARASRRTSPRQPSTPSR